MERVISTRIIHDGRIVKLREDTAVQADGRTVLREIVEHAEVAAIVPMDSDGKIILVRQYRLPAREALLEIPAGGANEGESIEDAAQRELREEIGCRAGQLEPLCGFFVSPGYCTEVIHVFLGTNLVEDRIDGDPDEVIALERLPLPEAVQLIDTGEIKDSKSVIGLLLAAKKFGELASPAKRAARLSAHRRR
jgi:ADP-ribose pyrophosphatase